MCNLQRNRNEDIEYSSQHPYEGRVLALMKAHEEEVRSGYNKLGAVLQALKSGPDGDVIDVSYDLTRIGDSQLGFTRYTG